MQSLAFLRYEMQMTQQYLHDKTFGRAESPADSANLNRPLDAIPRRRASVEQVSRIASAKQRRVRSSRTQNLFRPIGL